MGSMGRFFLFAALALASSACSTGGGTAPDIDLLGPPPGTWVGPLGTLRFADTGPDETGQFELVGSDVVDGQWKGLGSTQFEIIFARSKQVCQFALDAQHLAITDCMLAGEYSRGGQTL